MSDRVRDEFLMIIVLNDILSARQRRQQTFFDDK